MLGLNLSEFCAQFATTLGARRGFFKNSGNAEPGLFLWVTPGRLLETLLAAPRTRGSVRHPLNRNRLKYKYAHRWGGARRMVWNHSCPAESRHGAV